MGCQTSTEIKKFANEPGPADSSQPSVKANNGTSNAGTGKPLLQAAKLVEEQAATKIQALYRGFKTRVKLKEQAEQFVENPKQTEAKKISPTPPPRPPRPNSSAKSTEIKPEQTETRNTSISSPATSTASGFLSSLSGQFDQQKESIQKEAESLKQQTEKQIETVGDVINSGVKQLEKSVTEVKEEAEQFVQTISEQAGQAKQQLQQTIQGTIGGLIGKSSEEQVESKPEQLTSSSEQTESTLNIESTDLNTVQKDTTAEAAAKETSNQPSMEQLGQEILDIDLNDQKLGEAATKIQASFKGFKTRKGLEEERNQDKADAENEEQIDKTDVIASEPNDKAPDTEQTVENEAKEKPVDKSADENNNQNSGKPTPPNTTEEEEVIDIDLTDPDVEKAAVKIQAKFKGFRKNKKPA